MADGRFLLWIASRVCLNKLALGLGARNCRRHTCRTGIGRVPSGTSRSSPCGSAISGTGTTASAAGSAIASTCANCCASGTTIAWPACIASWRRATLAPATNAAVWWWRHVATARNAAVWWWRHVATARNAAIRWWRHVAGTGGTTGRGVYDVATCTTGDRKWIGTTARFHDRCIACQATRIDAWRPAISARSNGRGGCAFTRVARGAGLSGGTLARRTARNNISAAIVVTAAGV